jgi:hypothetical protein
LFRFLLAAKYGVKQGKNTCHPGLRLDASAAHPGRWPAVWHWTRNQGTAQGPKNERHARFAPCEEAFNGGWTPLMMAAMCNPNPAIMAVLLKAGARVNDETANGLSPIMLYCLANRNHEVLSLLVESPC